MFRLTAVSLLVALLGSLADNAAGHPCDAVSGQNKYVCDPDVPGDFYLCLANGQRYHFSCQSGLVFDNDLQACNWASNDNVCPTSAASTSAPTATTPTASTSTPTPSPTPSPTTPTTSSTTTPGDDSASTPAPPPSMTPFSGTGSQGHPCDTVAAGTMVCNPATGGQSYYICLYGGTNHENICPTGTRFDNKNQVCDWLKPGYVCDGPTSGGSGASTSTTSTISTTSAPLPQGACNASQCVLPGCLCMGTSTPRRPGQSLALDQVPQMVLLTFDDDINAINFGYYDTLFPANQSAARKNPNGCRTGATFFVSNNWTNMTMVRLLADRGSELASHSLDHSWPTQWSALKWDEQMEGMRQKMTSGTGVPASKIVGMRAPFLELGGKDQFNMLTERGFLYDSSMFGGTNSTADPLWPFTLAYPPKTSPEMCDQNRCPTRSYPKIWEVPIVRQYNPVSGRACSMTDAGCVASDASEDKVFNFLLHNFNRHYLTNRSPFMISLHATWFTKVSNSFGGLKRFLDYASSKDDVWQVTVTQMLDWVRDPKPLSDPVGNVGVDSWQCTASSQSLP